MEKGKTKLAAPYILLHMKDGALKPFGSVFVHEDTNLRTLNKKVRENTNGEVRKCYPISVEMLITAYFMMRETLRAEGFLDRFNELNNVIGSNIAKDAGAFIKKRERI